MTFRWLLAVATWLDRRFPPKVVVTQEMYDALQEKEHKHSKEIAKLSGEILVMKSEMQVQAKSIGALKELLVKGGGPLTISESARRAEFIATGRMGDAAAPPSPVEAR